MTRDDSEDAAVIPIEQVYARQGRELQDVSYAEHQPEKRKLIVVADEYPCSLDGLFLPERESNILFLQRSRDDLLEGRLDIGSQLGISADQVGAVVPVLPPALPEIPEDVPEELRPALEYRREVSTVLYGLYIAEMVFKKQIDADVGIFIIDTDHVIDADQFRETESTVDMKVLGTNLRDRSLFSQYCNSIIDSEDRLLKDEQLAALASKSLPKENELCKSFVDACREYSDSIVKQVIPEGNLLFRHHDSVHLSSDSYR